MEKLEINHVSFTYPKEEREALRDICMTVRPGSFVVLCGKSGCGKSTLLRSIKPTVRPHGQRSGSILIDGREVETLSRREMVEGIGFVMQDPASQTVCDKVWHELAFGPESIGMTTEEIRARVAEMASFFGIQNWFYQDVAALSGGQLQLLNLAAVMVMHPTLLLLDEPTAQLDPIAAHEFFVALEKIHHELGTTIILSEHRLEEALPMADHVVVMEDGGVFTQGTPREAAKALYAANHEMLGAFPLPMRLYAACAEEHDEDMPITVAEGRSWLMQKDLRPLPIYQEMDEPHTPICLSAENLWMRYAKELPDVLKGLSFRLHEGEWYSIVGGNGSGKTTALSMVLSAHRPHRGRIQRDPNMKVAAVPQDPRDLFAHKTVLEELTDAVGESGTKQEREERINAVVSSCELQGLLDRHPYDLSGGEQQRVALAMALSQRPRILLLDEPTKGLDAPFKNRLGRMLKRIQAQGVSIFMVSHDIEFCAAYADRCGMFFDGQIVSEGAPRRFFRDKTFYTTAAARMSRGILPQAVLEEDVAYALDLHEEEREESIENQKSEYPKSDGDSALTPQKKSRSVQTVIMGWIFAAAAVFTQLTMVRRYDDGRELLWQIAGIALAAAACGCLIPKKRFEILPRQKKKKLRRGTRLALWGVWLCMLMTVWVGMVILHDKKYYFISTLLVLEALAAFILALEGRRLSAREIVLISVFCALTVAGRVAFAALPQFKPMVALVILAGICFGGETGFFVGAVSAFVSNFYFVQGPWTPWQMLAMGAVGLAGGLCFEIGHITKTKAGLCAFGFGITLILYGGIMNLASAVLLNDTWSLSQLLTVYAMGFPFDVVHGISTVFFLWFGAEPMIEKVRRVTVKYGIGE